jgi:hypothetical protein
VICWELVGQGRKDEKRTPRKPQWWFCVVSSELWYLYDIYMIFIWYLYDIYMSHFVIVALFFQIGFPLSGEATAWSKIVRMQRDMSSDFLGQPLDVHHAYKDRTTKHMHKWIQRYSCYITSYTFWNHLDCINPHK